jgi:D-sedoheptulose 7-phosphate isomerase
MTLLTGRRHLDSLACSLEWIAGEAERIDRWGSRLARVLGRDGRLLAAGNGGSAAQAQHLTGELVGRYRDDRRPYSAIPLCTDSATVTAIGNDYGAHEVFARQVLAHGRPGDVLVALSTSGESPNVLAAVHAAARAGLTTWALTGRAPNPLAEAADEALAVPSDYTPTVQELHLVAIHLLCAAVDAAAHNVVSLAAAREARAL